MRGFEDPNDMMKLKGKKSDPGVTRGSDNRFGGI